MKHTKYSLFYRKLFKSIIITLIITSSIGLTNFFINSVVAKSSPINQQHSNVILIVADDLGYGDLGSYGQKIIQTPNLDKMASEGAHFTQFYSGSPTCRPARCTLMTGLHTGHCYLRVNSVEAGFRNQDFTIAEALKQKNIATGVIGKWALGEENSSGVPSKQGFDYFYGYLNQMHAHNYYPEFLIENNNRVSLQNEVPNPGKNGEGFATVKKEYSNDLFTNKAVDFISTHKDEQFFLYLPYTIPHANNSVEKLAKNIGLEVPDLGVYENMNLSDNQKSYDDLVFAYLIQFMIVRLLTRIIINHLRLKGKIIYLLFMQEVCCMANFCNLFNYKGASIAISAINFSQDMGS